jgi:hypothetical protein
MCCMQSHSDLDLVSKFFDLCTSVNRAIGASEILYHLHAAGLRGEMPPLEETTRPAPQAGTPQEIVEGVRA